MSESKFLTVPHLSTKELTRIFSKVRVNRETGCWEWTAALNTYGYGQVWYKGKDVLVHRLLYAWLVHPLPMGGPSVGVLDHIVCDLPKCCNPTHLRFVSNTENVERGGAISAINRRKTHCKHGHLLPTEPNRKPERKRPNITGRLCLTCAAIGSRKAYLKRLPEGPKKEALKRRYEQNPVPEFRDY